MTSPSSSQPHPHPTQVHHQKQIHRITTHPSLSPFRRRIYLVLLSIPPGRWTTYAALARYIATTSNTPTSKTTPSPNPKSNPNSKSKPKHKNNGIGSARAIGTAMRTNPFAPDVPCHRVLAADGTLGGYMGDGPGSGGGNLRRKREILEVEGVRFIDGEDAVGDGKGKGKGGKKGPRAEGVCFVDFVG